MPRRKVYYFRCQECDQDKPKCEESTNQPGVCLSCYFSLDRYKIPIENPRSSQVTK